MAPGRTLVTQPCMVKVLGWVLRMWLLLPSPLPGADAVPLLIPQPGPGGQTQGTNPCQRPPRARSSTMRQRGPAGTGPALELHKPRGRRLASVPSWPADSSSSCISLTLVLPGSNLAAHPITEMPEWGEFNSDQIFHRIKKSLVTFWHASCPTRSLQEGGGIG